MSQSKMSHVRVRAAEHRAKAIGMRLRGETYASIAEALGLTTAGAYKCVAHVLQDWRASCLENAEELVSIELARLDALQAACWGLALTGDLRAVETCLRVMAQRQRLLGLDQTPEVVSAGGQDVRIRVVYEKGGDTYEQDREIQI